MRTSTAAATSAMPAPLTCASDVQVAAFAEVQGSKVATLSKVVSSLGAGTNGDGAGTGSSRGVATKPPPDKSQADINNKHADANSRRTGFFEALLILTTVQAVQR